MLPPHLILHGVAGDTYVYVRHPILLRDQYPANLRIMSSGRSQICGQPLVRRSRDDGLDHHNEDQHLEGR